MSLTADRDYDAEFKDTADHRYAYNFDFDVMHKYMMQSFEPFLRPGSVLELGSFKGEFTRRLLPYFDDITCVEASVEAIAAAQAVLPARVAFLQGTFEKITLPRRYDNIVLTHVLEHLDDPVAADHFLEHAAGAFQHRGAGDKIDVNDAFDFPASRRGRQNRRQ